MWHSSPWYEEFYLKNQFSYQTLYHFCIFSDSLSLSTCFNLLFLHSGLFICCGQLFHTGQTLTPPSGLSCAVPWHVAPTHVASSAVNCVRAHVGRDSFEQWWCEHTFSHPVLISPVTSLWNSLETALGDQAHVYTSLTSNLQEFSCLKLPSIRITGMCHHICQNPVSKTNIHRKIFGQRKEKQNGLQR